MENSSQLNGLLEAAFDSVTPTVVQKIVASGTRLIEMADRVSQPETIELLQEMTRASESLTEMLRELEKMQESGALSALVEISGVIKTARDSITASVAARTLATGVKGLTLIDEMFQFEGDKLLSAVLRAVYESKQEIEAAGDPREKTITLRDLGHLLKDHEIQKSIWLMLKLMQKLPGNLQD